MSALTGIKVLDFTRLLPGPYCTWLLSDLGAEVTRVENPREVAKQARVFGRDKLSPDERRRIRQHDMLARDKRSIVFDIGHDRAKEVIHGDRPAQQRGLVCDTAVRQVNFAADLPRGDKWVERIWRREALKAPQKQVEQATFGGHCT